jgi:hypothetical protein
MYTYYNAHPKGLLVGDCVKRAISKAANMDYMEVQRELNRYKKVTGAKSYNSDYNPHKYVENVLHGVKMSFPAKPGKKRMTPEQFCKDYPRGHYILNMAGHWSCIVNGVLYDTWDCSSKCVFTAYKVTPETKYYKVIKHDDGSVSVHVTNEDKVYLTGYLPKAELKGYTHALEDLGFKKREL